MKIMRLRVKKEILLWDDFAPKGEEEFTLNVGEEYDVRIFDEKEAYPFSLPDEVYVPNHKYEDIFSDGWIQMVFDSIEDFWEYWEEIK